MRIQYLHTWDVTVAQALEIQRNLKNKVQKHNGIINPRLILGLDVSVNKQSEALAAAVILSFPELIPVESSVAQGKVDFPYIPGLLSFREIPLTLEACLKLKNSPDLVIVDGQGIAHPRQMGLASHIGLFLDLPTIGCAKSILTGKYGEVADVPGIYSEILSEEGEIIGAALRTRAGVKPVYVSIGHKIDLSSSIYWVLQCCRGYRLPEPTRIAHLISKSEIIESNTVNNKK